MKKLHLFVLVAAMFAISSCSVIGGIFKAGAAVGIIAVIIIIGIILWIVSAFRGKQ